MVVLKRIVTHELFKGSSVYLLASAVNSAIPFLLLPILTRYLTPAEYGEVAMFLVWSSIIGAFAGLSVHGAAYRKFFDYKDDPQKLGEYIFTCLIILTVSSVLILLLVLAAAPVLSNIIGLSVSWLILGVPVASLGFIVNLRLGQWQVRKLPIKYGVFQIGNSAANAGLSILFVVILLMGASGRIWGVVFSTLVFASLALLSLYRDKLIIPKPRLRMAKDALKFGVPLIPHIIGVFLLNTIDRAVITALLGLEQAGIYMVAIQISMAASIILDAVNRAFVPWLFERLKQNSPPQKVRIVHITYSYYVLLALGVSFGFIWAGDILMLIVSDNYGEAAQIVGWILLAKGFHGGYLMVTNYLFYKERTGLLSIVTIICGVLNVGLLFVFIPMFGLIGAAWAYCISKFIQWVTTWITAQKMVKMPWLKATYGREID